MAQFGHGKNAIIYANGYDLSKFLTKVTVAAKADTSEVSTLGTLDKQYLNGMMDSSISGDGFWDDSPNAVASVMGSAFYGATPSTPIVENIIVACPQGDALGKPAFGMKSLLTDFNVDDDTGGAGAVTVSGTNDDGLAQGVTLHPLSAETAGTKTGTHVDNGVPSQFGLDAYFTVTAATNPVNLKVQDSPDNITYADITTAIPVSARQSVKVTGLRSTVNRHLQVVAVVGVGGATYHASASRLNRSH